jgi:PAS domain S-box-containing protein
LPKLSLAETTDSSHDGDRWSFVYQLTLEDTPRTAFISRGCKRLLGASPSEFRDTPERFRACIHPDDRHALDALEEAADGENLEFELRMENDGGDYIRTRHSITVDRSADQVDVAEGVAFELTGEQAFSFDKIVESINDSILVNDQSGTIVYVNRRFADLIGYDRDEISGEMTIFDVVTAKGAQQLKELLAKRRQGTEESETDWEYELELRRKDGSTATGLITTTPVVGAEGAYQGTIAAITDITQRKEAESALAEAHDELEQRVEERTEELEQANAALQQEVSERRRAEERALEASRAKSAFLANMSHELRTPLNAVIGYTELLQDDLQLVEREGLDVLSPEDMERDLRRIHGAASHLLAIISDILDLSKVEAGRMDLHTERFDLIALLREVGETIAPLVDQNDNELAEDYHEDIATIIGDRTKLKQVLLNLASNASKFTENGRITLRATPEIYHDAPAVRMEVSDTGMGIPEDQLEELFEPFTQADDSTTREAGGTGLGLTICKRFVEMMGGEIDASSVPGEGSTFSFVIPVTRDGLAEESSDYSLAREISEPSDISDAEIDETTTKVLLIDDDSDVHELMRRFLLPHGFQVISAYSGETGIQYARKVQPDVIALDVMMPGKDGWSVLSELKSDEDTAAIPVVMVSMVDDRSIGYALGASEYLVKPIHRDRLIDTLSRFRPDAPEPQALVVEDEDDVREVVQRHLDRAGWSVSGAENGQVALDMLEEGHRPDVVILDLMMPKVDGFEVADRMRAHDEWSNIPIVVLTAMDLDDQDYRRLRDSVSRVIEKSATSFDEVVEQVVRIAETHPTASDPTEKTS